ncbi:hypothetical protein ACJDU8_21085 [Clostridium sp. WILCCON 0269]|uniref:Dystroglycan-type cadherin-like domain-containing protein n=1 Tax=Candidatus Clostridium eludens TaxID=3381663 RepID=A0ABW8SPL6_9CLOT
MKKRFYTGMSKVTILITIFTMLIATPALAANGDIWQETAIDLGSTQNILLNHHGTIFNVLANPSSYNYEVNGNLYSIQDANNQFTANPTYTPNQVWPLITQNDKSVASLPIITTTPLLILNAVVGIPYNCTSYFYAYGGTAPYTFTLASGSSMPPGLTLGTDGSITGTPTKSGSTNFTVVVTDSSKPIARTSSMTYSFIVYPSQN